MKSKKILIVDDEETSVSILTLAVGTKDRELIFAKDGDEAVRMALSHRPDLILMDVMLPRIDGYQATRIIKNIKELKHIPVVAITARTVDYDEEHARDAGCDDYVTKPFRMGDLRNKLEKYL